MSFEADFRTLLLSDASFSTAIGGRLFFARAPQQVASPYGVYHVISDAPVNAHDTAGDTLSERRLQVDLYCGEADPAPAVAAKDALKAFVNGAAPGDVGDTDFQELSWEGCQSGFENGLSLYRMSCDVMVSSGPA